MRICHLILSECISVSYEGKWISIDSEEIYNKPPHQNAFFHFILTFFRPKREFWAVYIRLRSSISSNVLFPVRLLNTGVRQRGLENFKMTWILFFFPFIFISWRLITLQYRSGFCHTLTWISHGFTCVPHPDPPPPPSPSHPSGSSQCTSPEHLSHASSLGWRSVSHLIVYMFQCCSLRSMMWILDERRMFVSKV